MTTRMRRLYWKALRNAEQTGAAEPPNPFDPSGPEAFLAWLNSPEERGPQSLSRYLYSIYLDRVDLQVYFRDLDGADGPRFLDWLWQVGIAPESIPMELRPASSPPAGSAPTPALAPGINVAGYFRAELGIGEAARLLTSAIDAAGIPHSTTTYDATLESSAARFRRATSARRGVRHQRRLRERRQHAAVRPRHGAGILRRPAHGRLLVLGGRGLSRARCTAHSTSSTRSGRQRISWPRPCEPSAASRCSSSRCRSRCRRRRAPRHAAPQQSIHLSADVRLPQRPRPARTRLD